MPLDWQMLHQPISALGKLHCGVGKLDERQLWAGRSP